MNKYFTVLLFVISITTIGRAQENVQEEATNESDKSPIYWLYDAHYRMAMQYSDYQEAKSALYNLVLLEPNNDSLRYNLAYIYFDNNQYPSTILACKDILAINPSHLGALELSAISFENLGLKDKALPHYEKLYMISSNLNSLYKMAFLQFDLKKFAECGVNTDLLLEHKDLPEAKVVFTDKDQQQKEYPMRVAVLNLKGLVNMEEGNNDVAKSAFEAALAIAPDFILASENLAKLGK